MKERIRSQPLALDDIESRLTLSVEKVASLLGLGRTAAHEAARRDEIPSRRLNRRVIVPVSALLNCLGVSAQAARGVGMQGHIRKRTHTTKGGNETVN